MFGFFSLFFQEKVQARDPPSTYLNKLKTYLDPKASKSSRKIQSLGDTNSTQVLRNLEISLRTNNIEWVREFLSEESQGLNILIEYLNSRLQLLRCKLAAEKEKNVDKPLFGSNSLRKANHHKSDFDGPRMAKQLRHSTKLKIGDATDDIHVCIMCLRAIMNNKFGFNMVIGHEQAINCIALSLVINSSTIFSNPF